MSMQWPDTCDASAVPKIGMTIARHNLKSHIAKVDSIRVDMEFLTIETITPTGRMNLSNGTTLYGDFKPMGKAAPNRRSGIRSGIVYELFTPELKILCQQAKLVNEVYLRSFSHELDVQVLDRLFPHLEESHKRKIAQNTIDWSTLLKTKDDYRSSLSTALREDDLLHKAIRYAGILGISVEPELIELARPAVEDYTVFASWGYGEEPVFDMYHIEAESPKQAQAMAIDKVYDDIGWRPENIRLITLEGRQEAVLTEDA